MALIYINDLKIRALIGTHAWERDNPQDVIVNMVIEYDSTQAQKSDKIKDALDYEALVKKITQAVERSHCFLLEKLAQDVLMVLKRDKRITGACVRLDKPQAIAQARSVGLELSFSR